MLTVRGDRNGAGPGLADGTSATAAGKPRTAKRRNRAFKVTCEVWIQLPGKTFHSVKLQQLSKLTNFI
ncbi:protein of unknown function [Pseudomonas sp. JV551A1]|uniref:Uncharacterized protein n=1 Tax=Pseudomonas inefficax TaxID=2078786 RepID=A0AAQ1PAK8_9PSED|nr:protein of unknown function [Pseudomonas sp. JV551A1]SPO61756.1 protein of unknown function [Pseudomonas inefficax]